MSKDYKPRSAPPKKSGGSFLLGMFVGFLAGVGLAAGIAIYFFKTPVPFVDKAKGQDKAAANLKDAKDGKGAKDDKPRFDFYRILPGQEEPVTDKQIKDAAKAAKAGDAPKDTYFLQAGSFQNPADADNLKAKLAMTGMEAVVEPTDLGDKGTWYRVRLGPYSRIDEIDRIRGQLAQGGVQTSLIRIKELSGAAKN
jgi:cell division protein FtsN